MTQNHGHTRYPSLDPTTRTERLTPPEKPVSMVVDTDTYNEIDDQFAVVDALLSEHTVEALYAAPFDNDRSSGPADGMERSYEELGRLLERLEWPEDIRYRGSESYLPGPDEPVESPAATDLSERARATDGPLYVVAIGAVTNVASALLADPDLVDELVVIWLGAQPHDWPTTAEFNCSQDLHAARVLFDSGVPLVHVPCTHVAEAVKTTIPELEAHLDDANPIEAFLLERFTEYAPGDADADTAVWSKEIWDLAATAWLTAPDAVRTVETHSPILTSEETWSVDRSRHTIAVATHIDRDVAFGSLFAALETTR